MKAELRRLLAQKRNSLSAADRRAFSGRINEKLIGLKRVSGAERVLAYCAFGSETDVSRLLEYCESRGIIAALPRITGRGIMEAALYRGEGCLKKNKYGIYEPHGTGPMDKRSIDVVIVPALAFDKELYRLGYGGGYYDRFLSGVNAVKIGVCFDIQIADKLPREKHDIKMDAVVTETRILGEAL